MKRVFALWILTTAIQILFSQNEKFYFPFDSITNKVTYKEIIKVDSTISKKELFGSALEWIALNYKSANNVIQLKDENAGKIIVKGIFEQGGKDWRHTIIIEIKEGRSRITITDFVYTINSGTTAAHDCTIEEMILESAKDDERKEFTQKFLDNMHKVRRELDIEFDKQVREFIESYRAHIQKSVPAKSDSW